MSLLSRQTGFNQSHLSNFLNSKRHLSLYAMDRILHAQHLAAGDLLPAHAAPEILPIADDVCIVPVVSHAAATDPFIRRGSIQALLHLPASTVQSARVRATATRRMWQRFIAVRIASDDAMSMDPVLSPDAYVVIDRHYNSLIPYWPHRPTLYAIRRHARLVIRYLDFKSNHLILRPRNQGHPVELLEIEPDATPGESITGRVLVTLNNT